MNYEEKYKEALERAKKLHDSYNLMHISVDEIEQIFPELADSEDERIRKAIINGIQECQDAGSIFGTIITRAGITYLDVYAWLEKQKEQKVDIDKLRRDLYQSGYNDGYQHGKEDAQKEQKPAEWSEEDEKMIGRIRSVVNECAFYNDALDVNGDYCEGDYAKLDAWLKSLPLNLKKKNEDVAKLCSKEWSQEDEDRIRQIERIAQQAGCTQKLQEEIHDWLKSLRPSWKPSEEQMNELWATLIPEYEFDCDILKGLYYDLKKLMEDKQ